LLVHAATSLPGRWPVVTGRHCRYCHGAPMVSPALGREWDVGESLVPACGPMTATPSGAIYLLEGVIFPIFLISGVLTGESLDLVVGQ